MKLKDLIKRLLDAEFNPEMEVCFKDCAMGDQNIITVDVVQTQTGPTIEYILFSD